jgi:pimeloyl-ACP methyl ester carboxylesterase
VIGGARRAASVVAAAAALLALAPAAEARQRWYRCRDAAAACTMVRVPLDRSGAVRGAVRIRVARFSRGGRGRPTLLYLSGGPGGAGVEEFAGVLSEVPELGERYQLVTFDQRGTGYSGLLRCPTLERDPRLRSTRAGEECARRLGPRRVFYTTQDSAEDVEAIRRALGAKRLTLFGISYGTKLALAYARAHPDRVARLALDSVLDPDAGDAFGLEAFRAVGPSLAALCPARCRGVTTDPVGDVAALATRLRTAPLRGAYFTPRGRRRVLTLTSLALADLLFDSDYNPALRAGVPAAVRAALDHGDAAPLLRLAETADDYSALPSARAFSAGRYAALCEETPLPWPRGTPFAERFEQARARASALGAGAFFPFDFAEARADEIDLCLRWPESAAPPRPGPAAGAPYPRVPALVLQGGEDLRTPPAESARLAAQIGARRIVIRGVGHAVVGGDPSGCGVRRLLTFLRGRRVRGGCARVPTHVPAVGVLPSSLDQLAPAAGSVGRAGRTVAAIDVALDDLTFVLSPALDAPIAGPGLRGGRYRVAGRRVVLRGFHVVPGVRLSGALTARGARLRVSGPAAARGSVRISPAGLVRGRLGGRAVRARLRAGPPRPAAARSSTDSAQFRDVRASFSVRRPT